MKKRISPRKKIVRSKSGRKDVGHLHIHRIFIYTSGGIFALTLLFALVQTSFQPFALQGPNYASSQNVLGDEDDNSGSGKQEDENKEAEKQAEEQKKAEERASEQAKHEAEQRIAQQKEQPRPTVAPNSIKVQTQREGKKSETEIETSDGRKIKTKVEDDGTTKIEVEHKKLKIKYEIVNGQFITKAEDEDGEEVELEDGKLEELEDEVEDELEDDGIKIASSGAGKIKFAKNKFSASTHFPLAIDTGTNQLVVTTPAGQKVVAVLPDEAVQNMLATGVINALAPDESGSVSGDVEFTVENDVPVYKIAGLKKFKFFGFIPTTQPVTAVVSSETGAEIKTEEPFFTKFVDLLSP